jgi:hypothetical protein
MECWSVEKKIKPFASTPILHYSNDTELIEFESFRYGAPYVGLWIG